MEANKSSMTFVLWRFLNQRGVTNQPTCQNENKEGSRRYRHMDSRDRKKR